MLLSQAAMMLTAVRDLSFLIWYLLSQMREGEGPSYHNPLEAGTLVNLLVSLLQVPAGNGGSQPVVGPRDVGVIATYRKQVRACSAGQSLCAIRACNRVLLRPLEEQDALE